MRNLGAIARERGMVVITDLTMKKYQVNNLAISV
jgi:hypothetical protein